MGKTHLLQGAARRFQAANPGAKVRYVSAETFTNEYIAAVKAGKLEQFRAQSRGVALLALDDVHFVAGKESTQNELLHTLDAIGMHHARVLMASDEHPRAIKDFSSKLASRCMAGAVVRIDAPDPKLRRALIASLAARRSLLLTLQACELIAMRSEQAIGSLGGFGGSVREIEGLLNSVQAVSRIFAAGSANGQIDESLVRRALGIDQVPQPAPTMLGVRRPIPVGAIIDHVCEQLAVERTQFAGKGRHRRVVLARAIVAFLARELTTQSFPEIARAMGRGNHSTVITAQRRLQRQLASGSGSGSGSGSESDEILNADLSPLQPGVKLGEFIRTLSAQIRQTVR
jgi:chromosomal replication initiator protein